MSYINEIEKGKKYPKTDKIMALAAALGVEYDALVSLKLSKRLEPISELLSSNILSELPLELFGIDPSTLLEMLSDAPTRVSAFIGTLIEVSRNYNVSVERFYHSALRTYQEMHDNYFEEIEQAAEDFLATLGIADDFMLHDRYLQQLLTDTHGYKIEAIDAKAQPELAEVRSLAIPQPGGMKLLLNRRLSKAQRAFIFGRELGYRYLSLSPRLYTTTVLEAESFEHLLNNFKASYFASAVIMRRTLLVPDLNAFFAQTTWQPDQLTALMARYNTTPESFCYRISNLLPRHFGINQLFFLRISHYPGQERFDLTKEMHIARKHIPHTVKDEYYCRRWLAITALQELAALPPPSAGRVLCRSQISQYVDSGEEYLMISFAAAAAHPYTPDVSVTMGIFLNQDARNRIGFCDDPSLQRRVVNETCDRCGLFDCKERVAAPAVLLRRHKNDELRKTIKAMLRAPAAAATPSP